MTNDLLELKVESRSDSILTATDPSGQRWILLKEQAWIQAKEEPIETNLTKLLEDSSYFPCHILTLLRARQPILS